MRCKCEHWQICQTCTPERFDDKGELKPPPLTPLQEAHLEIKSLKENLIQLEEKFLTQDELSIRWRISGATLERDRSLKQGVQYLKIGGLIRYRLRDIVEYEDMCAVKITRKTNE